MPTGNLRLELVNVRGEGIRDDVRLELASLDTSHRYRKTLFVDRAVQLNGMEAGPFTRYLVTVWPSDYLVSQFFIVLREGQTVRRDPVVLPVDASKVTGIVAPAYAELPERLRAALESSSLDAPAGLQGAALYNALDPSRKACLLNICTKAAGTLLHDGSTCLDHIGGLIKLRGDRFFARSSAALREEVQNARGTFVEVNGALHHPPDGYTPAKSFKTLDRYGNLQLTFFRRGETGDDYLMDADIDEAAGIEHGFEVARNHLTGHTTNPYEIRDILIRHQALNPPYEFQFAEEIEAAAGATA